MNAHELRVYSGVMILGTRGILAFLKVTKPSGMGCSEIADQGLLSRPKYHHTNGARVLAPNDSLITALLLI